MSIASYHQSLLTNALTPTHSPKKKNPNTLKIVLYQSTPPDGTHHSPSKEFKIAKLAIVTLAAGVLTLGTVQDASAAKTGGRVGGQAFRSSAPRSSAPRIDRSRTNIYVNPPIAPPLVGGYGFGVPFYGGWGWSPFSYFTPGPSVAIGVGGGFEVFALLLFLSVIAAAIRRFIGPRSEDDDY